MGIVLYGNSRKAWLALPLSDRPLLNNMVEQDRRALKRRINAKQGFRSFEAARRTIPSYEVMQHDPKGASEMVAGNVNVQVRFINLTLEPKTV